jgi:UDP-N-acetylmuramate dehydrogenase
MNEESIRSVFRGRIGTGVPLAKYTSFQIGGPAEYFLEPADREDLAAAVSLAEKEQAGILLLGRGSNMLVSDDGVRGIVINLERGLADIRLDGDGVYVDAGVGLARFVDFCIRNEFAGVEMLPGIPGTIGGALMMNAGAYGGEISDHVAYVEVLRNGAVTVVPKDQCAFRYRRSGFQGDVILGALFKLPRGAKADLMKQRRELLLKRSQHQPLNLPNSGSMFKNPSGTFAAKLIEEAGLKGTIRGKAQISPKHANFFVNLGGASAQDVVRLIRLAKETVKRKCSVALELEIKLIGFPPELSAELFS